jgi:DNA-binding NarL/FixJ family response regulator
LKDFAITDFEKLSDIFPVSNILVLTSNINKEYTLSVLAQGITHFILKTCSKDDFLNSLIGITQNEDYLCKHAIEMLLNKNSSVTLKKDKDVHLTKKEIEIIRAVAQGMTTKEIASKSFLSVHTVNTHRRNILKKLGFSNTSELVLYAVRNGITETLEYYI